MKFIIFLIWFFTGIITGVVASDKGHAFGSWLFAGLLLGPLGLLAAAGLSDRRLRQFLRNYEDPYHAIKSPPKLLFQSKGNNPNDLIDITNGQTEDSFVLDKSTGDDALWESIINFLNSKNSKVVNLAAKSNSGRTESLTGGIAFLLCDDKGHKLALAYAKQDSTNENYIWRVRMY